MFKKSILIILVILLTLLGACAQSEVPVIDVVLTSTPSPTATTSLQTNVPTPSPAPSINEVANTPPEAKYVIFLIGDGMGEAHKKLSEEFLKYISADNNAKLSLNSMNVNSMISTGSFNASITDSAAAATALATGVKTNNHVISLTPDEDELTTILEAASDSGFATGVVSTSRITHATPACFYAHNTYRTNEAEIALDLLNSDIDFIAGGGLASFIPGEIPESFFNLGQDTRGMDIYTYRNDDINLVEKFAEKGYEMFLGQDGVDDFLDFDPNSGDKVFAPLSYNYFPYEIDRINKADDFISLSDVTSQAIRLLSLDEDGFFLMVEGGRIDYAAHNNDALGVIYDTLAFDNAVKVALEFYAAHPNETLVITTADHETGGLTLAADFDYTKGFENVNEISASYGDGFALIYESGQTFDEFISKVKGYGLVPTNDELTVLRNSFEEAKLVEYGEDEINTAASLGLIDILNTRIGVKWTSDYHTSAKVALGVTGVFDEQFANAHDNIDIANILADILQLDIGR